MSTHAHNQPLSRREAMLFTKVCRARAHKEGTTFGEALTKLDAYKSRQKFCRRACCMPRQPKRSGRSVVPHVIVDGAVGAMNVEDKDVYDFKIDFPEHEPQQRNTDRTVNLLDIARPATRKGPAKHFEVIPRVRQVITLDDGSDLEFEALDDFVELGDVEDWSLSDEEWEAIFEDELTEGKKSYSSALRDNER